MKDTNDHKKMAPSEPNLKGAVSFDTGFLQNCSTPCNEISLNIEHLLITDNGITDNLKTLNINRISNPLDGVASSRNPAEAEFRSDIL